MKQDAALSPAIDLAEIERLVRARADDAKNDALYRLPDGVEDEMSPRFLKPSGLGFISKGDPAEDERALAAMAHAVVQSASHVRANRGQIRWVQEPTFSVTPIGYDARWHFELAA